MPYVRNFSKSEYRSGNQNWSVAEDEHHVMYFGNTEGLLRFDGARWQQYQFPNRQIVRAVASGNGRLYGGGFGEFGYWDHRNGRMSYHSLIPLLPKGHKLNEEIWKIYVANDRVIFQSFGAIYVYKDGTVKVLSTGHPYLFLLKAGTRYFVKSIQGTMKELKDDRLIEINDSKKLSDSHILTILPFGNDRFLIGTARHGLFLMEHGRITPWETEASAFLQANQLNNGCVVMDQYFAFGTILKGVVIIDRKGKLVQFINKDSGLQNNTVLALHADASGGLWAALDNGVDRIELNSPFYFYFDTKGSLGTVYAGVVFKDKVYLGTNQGLFYSNLSDVRSESFKRFDFRLIAGSQGQTWELTVKDGQLFCGHNEGTFIVEGEHLRLISSVNGGWTLRSLKSHPDKMIQGTYNGLVLYANDPGRGWSFGGVISGFDQPARYVEEGARGEIWAAHVYKGLYKIEMSDDLKHVRSSRFYSGSHGLPPDDHVNVFDLENRIVFTTRAGVYTYDDLTDRFNPYTHLNKRLGSFSMSHRISKAGKGSYWFFYKNRTALVKFDTRGGISIDSSSMSPVSGRMVSNYENISRLDESGYLVSIDNGFSVYTVQHKQVRPESRLPKIIFSSLEDITGETMLVTEQPDQTVPELSAKQNNIRISYALPYYSQAKVEYQYFLDGYSKQWSPLSSMASREFTNLSQGAYTFKVRALVDSKYWSETSSFNFSVAAPWYLSRLAILVYVILHLLVIAFIYRLYQKSLLKHRKKIEERLQLEKEEEMRRQELENERKQVRQQTEQLKKDFAHKAREATNSAMNIVYKNELLQKIRDELTGLRDSSGQKLGEDQLRRINKVIDEGKNDDRDWNIFEQSFNETHENFFKKLKATYPELVPNDLKLCAYLRMNMNSKEIASLLNITLRGVEIRRYRLRKKLNLDHNKNLAEFFMEL